MIVVGGINPDRSVGISDENEVPSSSYWEKYDRGPT